MQQSRRFWVFHLGFWMLAGFLLFLSGWAQGGAYISLVRNLYLTGAGLLLALPLGLVLAACRGREVWQRLVAIGLTCFGCSLLVVLVINPITFMQLGLPQEEMGFRVLTAGSMNYAMVLALWCFFHEALVMRADDATEAPVRAPTTTITVQKGNVSRSLNSADIDWIAAAGDYVEIHAAGETFLKRATMTAMEKMLPDGAFLRVHRSCIVARAAVTAVEGKTKGAFLLLLRDGAHVDTGRSFQAAVEEAFL